MVNNGFMPVVIGTSALPVLTTLSLSPSSTSHTQPLPNWAIAAVASSFLHAFKVPKEASIFCFNTAGGSMPRFKNDFGPALLARIKVFISFGRPVEWQFVRDDEGRFSFSLCDQLAQLAVVCFYICLASPYVLALDPKLAKVECNLTLLGQFILGVRVLSLIHISEP